MALNDVTFNISTAGLGRAPLGEDFISGMIFYVPSLPSGWSTDAEVKNVKSFAQASALGLSANTTDAYAYHINEYFKQNPDGDLYILCKTGTTTSFDEVSTIQTQADGKIRQLAVYQPELSFNTTHVSALQTEADSLFTDHMPVQIMYAAQMSGSTIGGLSDLKTLSSPNVSVVVGQDGAGDGHSIFTATSKSVSCIGAALGVASLASVSDSIAAVKKFNVVKGTEYDTLAFATGEAYKNQTAADLGSLDDKSYIFLRSFIGKAGSYFADSWTAEARTKDYSTIENNRTIHKAVRGVYALLLDELNGSVELNASGELGEDAIARYKSLAALQLEAMQRAKEISAFKVIINPAQNVLSTSKVEVTLQIVPIGVSRNIEVNVGFVLSV